jgi:hypothetical protein
LIFLAFVFFVCFVGKCIKIFVSGEKDMKIRVLFLVFIILATVSGAIAQGKTVTDADLEKYKQARLQAARDYRENYERLGMPSPDELEKRREASRSETDKLYDRLRAERLETERLRAIQAAANAQIVTSTQFVPYGVPYYNGGSHVFYSNGRFPRINRVGRVGQGYVGGGQFWSTGPRTIPRPIRRGGYRR